MGSVKLIEFLTSQKKSDWLALLKYNKRIKKLCYLSDIFERLNLVNRSLQGKDFEPDNFS